MRWAAPNALKILLIAIEMANDYRVSGVCRFFFFVLPFFFALDTIFLVIVVYLSDEIHFPCACARLLHELRWCPFVGFVRFRSIYSFRFSPFFFNVISLSRWKIFMANGSAFYTQRVVNS